MRSGRAFNRIFVLLFLILAIVSMSLGFAVLQLRQESQRAALLDSRQADAQRIASAFDAQLLELFNMAERLKKANWAIKLAAPNAAFAAEFDALHLLDLCSELKDTVSFNKNLDLIAVVAPERDLVITSVGWFSAPDFSSYMGTRFGVAADTLEASLAQGYGDFLAQPYNQNDSSFLLISSPLAEMGAARGSILLVLRRYQLQAALQRIAGNWASDIALCDAASGREVLSVSLQTAQTPLELRASSGLLHAEYAVSYDFAGLYAYRVPTLLFCLFGAWLLSGLLAYLLARISYRPLTRVLEILGTKSPRHADEMETIAHSIRELHTQNTQLGERLKIYFSAARSNALVQLLRGRFVPNGAETLQQYGIPFGDDMQFCVAVIGATGDMDTEAMRGQANLLECLVRAIGALEYPFEVIEVAEGETAAIVGFPGGAPEGEPVYRAMLTLQDELFRSRNLSLDVHVGPTYPGLIGISKSYQDAEEARLNRRQSHEISYPLDWEEQMIRCFWERNLPTLLRILDEIRLENERRNLSGQQFLRLATLVEGTFRHVACKAELDASRYSIPLNEMLAKDGRAEIWRVFYEQAKALLADMPTGEEGAMDPNDAMVRYVNEHFTDSDISLKSLGERFHISASSASRMFRNASGSNFHEYVSQLRLKRAKRLLADGKMSVEQIARTVGYESDTSFRRAFQRQTGMTPREWTEKS